MRICHVVPSLDPIFGGLPEAVRGLIHGQLDAGLEHVTVITTVDGQHEDRSVIEELQGRGVNVVVLGPVGGPLQRYAGQADDMANVMRDADVVHTHGLWVECQHIAATWCRKNNKPYIMAPHGMLDPWSLSQSKWKKRLYMAWRMRRDLNGASGLHFTTDAELDLIKPLGLKINQARNSKAGGPEAMIEPNGIVLKEYEAVGKSEPNAFTEAVPELQGQRYVVFLSRLHHKKGLHVLIPAFAEAVRGEATLEDVKLVLAGPVDDAYRVEVMQMIERAGLTDRVILPGMVRGEAKLAALANAEVMALISHQENFGIVVVESLAAGVPVIVSDQVNLCDMVAETNVGSVVEMDVAQTTQALREWLSNDEQRKAIQTSGPAVVRERYDWAAIGQRWMERYQKLLG